MFDEKLFPHVHEHMGAFPPEKPRYTMTENVEHITREMRSTIDRLLRFEERLKNEFNDLMVRIGNDNALFKDTFSTAHTTFIQEVKNEVNAFERNVDATVRLWQTDTETNYATLSEDVKKQIADYMTSTQELFDAFKDAIETRLEDYNTNHGQAFADYQQKLTTEINTFEATVNANFTNFTNSMTETMQTFQNTWTQIVEQRLDTQDAKISDAEMYMKTNLVGTVTQTIGDMKDSGELADIIEGEVFTDLENKINNTERVVNVMSFGAVGDGETNDTNAFTNAINVIKENGGGILYIPKTYTFAVHSNGVLCLDICSNIEITGGGRILLADGSTDGTQAIISNTENIENVYIHDIIVDGNEKLTKETISNVSIINAKNVVIENVTCKNANFCGLMLRDTIGQEQNKIINNTVLNTGYIAIQVTNNNNVLIANNIIDGTVDNGIDCEGNATTNESVAGNIVIANNVIDNIGNVGVFIESMGNIVVNGNTMENIKNGIYCNRINSGSFRNIITSNRIKGTGEEIGIRLNNNVGLMLINGNFVENFAKCVYCKTGIVGVVIESNYFIPVTGGVCVDVARIENCLVRCLIKNNYAYRESNSKAFYFISPIGVGGYSERIYESVVNENYINNEVDSYERFIDSVKTSIHSDWNACALYSEDKTILHLTSSANITTGVYLYINDEWYLVSEIIGGCPVVTTVDGENGDFTESLNVESLEIYVFTATEFINVTTL